MEQGTLIGTRDHISHRSVEHKWHLSQGTYDPYRTSCHLFVDKVLHSLSTQSVEQDVNMQDA